MENIINDAIPVLIGCVCTWIAANYFFKRKRKWNEKVNDYEFEISYIEKMRKSSIELNRRAFMDLFLILFLISIGLTLATFNEHLSSANIKIEVLNKIVNVLEILVFTTTTAIAFYELKNFYNIVNYKKSLEKYQEKIRKLDDKIDHT